MRAQGQLERPDTCCLPTRGLLYSQFALPHAQRFFCLFSAPHASFLLSSRPLSGKGGRERKGRRATLNQLPGDDEPFSARSEPLSGYSGTPRSQQHQVGFGGATTAPTKTRASPQRPRRSLGSVPWQTTMGTVDIISRPPNPEPAELHRGPKYNRLQAAPSTSTTKQLAAAAILSNN